MDDRTLLLLVTKNADLGESLRRCMVERGCELRRVPDANMATARIGGGGVGGVLLDWTAPPAEMPDDAGSGWDGRLSALSALRRSTGSATPIVVLGSRESAGLPSKALLGGADAFLDPSEPDAGEAIAAAIAQEAVARAPEGAAIGPPGTVVALVGAKGGVGTTMTAWNLASALAAKGSVILAELRTSLGTLATYFRPGQTVRRLSHLVNEGKRSSITRELDLCLWSCPKSSGIRVLFGPQSAEECKEVSETVAAKVIEGLAQRADFVVLDLPAATTPLLRGAIQGAGYLALLVEREPVCIDAAKRMLAAIESWDVAVGACGVTVVNRAPLVAPLSMEEVQTELGLPIITAIPPAPDLCVQSQRMRVPFVDHDPDSLAAGSIVALAEAVHQHHAATHRTAKPALY